MRKRITFSLPEEMIEQLKRISEQTMIPQARLVEQAINQVIEKYNKSK
ncbi:ribbon-helix-helix domain-containing protein [Bacillus sp. BSL6]